MTYETIAYFGYAINTTAPAAPAGTALAAATDIGARCQLMMNAIRCAAKGVAPSPTELKVFVAPESFFNSAGEAYTIEQVQSAVDTLQEMVAGADWNDWVFVFGTIDAVSADPIPQSYRFCLVQQGGAASGAPLLASAVLAQFSARINAVNLVAGAGGVLIGQLYGAPGANLVCDGAGVFPLAGLSWGIDLRDQHGGASILRPPCLPADSPITVQLVLSRGASVLPQNIAAAEGGYVLSCDGSGSGAGAAAVGAGDTLTALAPASTCKVPDTALDLGGSPPTVVPVSSLFTQGPGLVSLYAPVPVAVPQPVGSQVVALDWPASDNPLYPSYSFNFSLVYDSLGNYQDTLCQVVCSNLDFKGLQYTLPFTLKTEDGNGDPVAISLWFGPASGDYQQSIQGEIRVPGFDFDGAPVLFSNSFTGTAPATIW